MQVKVIKQKVKKPQFQDKVTRHTNLGELVALYPEAADIMLEWGLHCVGCFANSFDTIEAGAQVHGLSEEDINTMISEINISVQSPKA